jgi:hypothetical protein
MGELEEIMAFRSRFDGMVNIMAQCKIVIPPILMVRFFLHLLHSCYNDLLEQFRSRYKPLKGISLNSIVVDIHYQDKFQFVGSDKKAPAPKGPKAVAAVASPHVDKQGKEWNNPYECLASFNIKSVKKQWQ